MIHSRHIIPKLLLPVIVLLNACSFNPQTKKTSHQFVSKRQIVENALDTILGDKLLSSNPAVYRKENFKNLIELDAKYLFSPSAVYQKFQLDSNTYVLQYAKHYLTSRRFFLIVRTDGSKIVNYKLINDYCLADHKTIDNGYLFMANADCIPEFGLLKNYLSIIKLDRNLQEKWKYSPAMSYKALVGDQFLICDDYITCQVHINEASTIVYHSFAIVLNEKGECVDATETGQLNCIGKMDQETVNAVLNLKHLSNL